jgi:3-deoxy-D-manno-octulosonic-acid transferase
MGPHTFNFAEVAERAEAAGAAVRAADMPVALIEAAALLALDPVVRRQRALDFAAESGGAVRRTVDALLASGPGFT